MIFTSFGHFSNDSIYLVYPLLITYYSAIPGLNLVLLGTLAVVYQLIYGALSTPVGMLADKTRDEGLMVAIGITILAFGMGSFAASFAFASYRLVFIILGVLLLGSGTAFYHPIGASVLKESYKEKAASMMGINGSMGSLGRSVMPILLVFLITALGASFALGIISAELLLSALILYVGLLPFNRSFGKSVYRKSDAKPGNVKREKGTNVFKSGYVGVLLPLVAIIFVRAMFMTGTTTFVPEYLKSTLHSEVLIGSVLTASFLFAILGQLAFGYLTSRKGGRFTITLTSLFSFVTFILFLYAGSNVYLVAVMYALFIFFTFNGFAVILGYVNQLVPDKIANSSNAFTWGVGQILGGATGIGIITIMIAYIKVGEALWYMVIFSVVSIAMLPLLYRKRKMKNNK